MNFSSLAPAVLVVVATLTLSGCTLFTGTPLEGLVENIPGVGDRARQKFTEEMFADIADPLVRKNMVAMMNQGKFRMRSTFGMGNQVFISTTETEMKGESFSSKSSQEKGGEISGETIMMGDTTYMKDYTDNAWWKQVYKPEELPEEAKEMMQDFNPENMKEFFDKSAVSTFTQLAEEACPTPNESLNCYKFKETYAQGGERTWWFDTKQFLTRRDESGTGQNKMVADYSYENISITVPTPVKEVPEGRSIYEMSFGQEIDFTFPGGEQPDYTEMMEQYEQFSENMPDFPSAVDFPAMESESGL